MRPAKGSGETGGASAGEGGGTRTQTINNKFSNIHKV